MDEIKGDILARSDRSDGRSISLVTNRLLVVALSQQRPDLDRRLRVHLYEQIRWYRQRLERVNPDIGKPGNDGLRLYRPTTALLWGTYDQATFFLADDFDAVTQIAPGLGAISRDFLICSPYEQQGGESTTWPAASLLSRDPPEPYKYIVIVTVRLAAQVVSALGGVETRIAIATRVAEFVENQNETVGRGTCTASVYRCWSGPDLVIIFQTNATLPIRDFERHIREISLAHLWPFGPPTGCLEAESLPARLLQTWRKGRKTLFTAINQDNWKDFHGIDAACHIRIHLGVHEPGWTGLGYSDPQEVFSALLAVTPLSDTVASSVRAALAEALLGVSGKSLSARGTVSLEVKPGHIDRVLATFADLSEKADTPHLNADATNVLQALEQSLGDRPQLRVRVPLEIADAQTLDRLFLISHGIRLLPEFNRHILSVETRISLEPASSDLGPEITLALSNGRKMNADDAAQASDEPFGYDLLAPRNDVDALHVHRLMIRRYRLPRSQEMALHAVLEHLDEAVAQPHSFSSAIAVRSFTGEAIRGLLRVKPGELAPEATRILVEAIETAARQRTHYDTSPKARVPLSAYLPYGLAQLVAVADGVVSALFEARATTSCSNDWPQGDAPDCALAVCRTLILLKPSPAVILHRFVKLNVSVINVSLVNLLSPALLLTSLFHEVGHTRASQKISLEAVRAARAALERLDPQVKDSKSPITARDLSVLISDIVPHVYVLIVGCDGDYTKFEEQFLFAHACGARLHPPDTRSEPIDEWALILMTLAIQQAIHCWLNDPNSTELRVAVKEFFQTGLTGDSLPAEAWFDDAAETLTHAYRRWWEPEITFAEGPSAISRGLLAMWLGHQYMPLIQELTLDTVVNVKMWNTVADEIIAIRTQTQHLEGATSPEIVQAVSEGLVPSQTLVEWDTICRSTGVPTFSALQVVRDVYRGVQNAHGELQCSEPNADKSISRSPDSWGFIGVYLTATDETSGGVYRTRTRLPRADGLFSDPAGGPFVCGTATRSKYLAMRVAALEVLSSLAEKLNSALLLQRFNDGRKTERHVFPPLSRQNLYLKRDGDPYPCHLIDICAGTVKVEVSTDFADSVHKGTMLWIGGPDQLHCVFCSEIRKLRTDASKRHLVLMRPRAAERNQVELHRDKPPNKHRQWERESPTQPCSVQIDGKNYQLRDYSRVGISVLDPQHSLVEGHETMVVLPEGVTTMTVIWTNPDECAAGLERPIHQQGKFPHIAEMLNLPEPTPWAHTYCHVWISPLT